MTPVLIGRDHPAARLRADIERATQSHGGLVLVTGEAGIGKTSLVTEAAGTARDLGALVLTGTCWSSGSAPGYWPWVQVVRGLRRALGEDALAAAQEAAGSSLSVLLGEARPLDDPSSAFRVYDAVTTALVTVSQDRPVMVVLDDLHWSDSASLKLLEFAAGHAWFERLLLVGTYRDAEVETEGHPLRTEFAPLTAKAGTLALTGLDTAGTGELITRVAGRAPDPELAAEVWRRTGGNPFFVEQTARLWAGGGSVSAIAPGVREAVRHRLDLLPPAVAALLGTAAVLGREFHRQVLAAVAGDPVAHVDRLLGQAVTARLVASLGGGRFGFAHDLVRETLQEAFDETEAGARHAAVVTAVEAAPSLADKLLLSDLARHAHLAGDAVPAEAAVRIMQEAARDAAGRLAYDEQLTHLRRAEACARRLSDPAGRVLVLLDLADACDHFGESAEARTRYDEATALAREQGDAELLARVALTCYGHAHHTDPAGADAAIQLLREAYTAVVGPAGADRRPERLAQDLSIRTAVLARRHEDDEALGFSLWARHHSIWGPGTAAERLALIEELILIARRRGDADGEMFARALRWVALLELGDPRTLDAYHTYVAFCEKQDLPRAGVSAAIDQSIVTGLLGRFTQSESFLAESLAFGERTGLHDHFTALLEHHRWTLALLQGRADDAARIARTVERHHPCPRLLAGITAIEASGTAVARGLGRLDPPPGAEDTAGERLVQRARDTEAAVAHARELLGRGAEPDRGFLPLRLRFQAQAAAASGDPELIGEALRALEPFEGQWAVSLFGWDVSGPIAHWTAVCEAALGHWEAAAEGFERAHRSAERLTARPWSVEARSRLAEVRIASGADAAKLLEEVEREAAELGMRHVVRRVAGLRAAAPAGAHQQVADEQLPSYRYEFRPDGPVWNLTYEGTTVHLPDAKGLRDLRTLLSRPGTDIPAVQLLAPAGGAEVVAAGSLGGDAVLDEEAKRQYRRRLERLDEEIDRAAAAGDSGRAAEYDRERAALLDELRLAAGLGGRARRLGDEAERARKAVTARIRDTLRRIDARHPALGEHLRGAVSTGLTCAYRPGGAVPDWRL
ncbi:ATPase [Streptomyces triticagri]|uniref:ATPase n=1 Tax=Streptomyces triticagri TaxID=2293568 RepID=A0A372M4N9_9ACTN|nr:AAA family ATPase [Streptomyces triticagri]RFU85908.1 ATPase [Streptomyces triticagri]